VLVGIDKLSKETRKAVEEFIEGVESRVNIHISRDAGDHLWSMVLTYLDDDSKPVAVETYMTVRGHSGYVAQFIVFYQDDGQHVDFSTWSPMPIFTEDEDGKLKTLSDFVEVVIDQLTPHPITAELVGIEDDCSCGLDDDDVDESGGGDDEANP